MIQLRFAFDTVPIPSLQPSGGCTRNGFWCKEKFCSKRTNKRNFYFNCTAFNSSLQRHNSICKRRNDQLFYFTFSTESYLTIFTAIDSKELTKPYKTVETQIEEQIQMRVICLFTISPHAPPFLLRKILYYLPLLSLVCCGLQKLPRLYVG